MIITLVKADFSANNIGTLDSFAVLTNILNATYSGPTSVASGEAFTATITLKTGYNLDNISISMGGNILSEVYTINDNIITINIPSVNGIICINVNTNDDSSTVVLTNYGTIISNPNNLRGGVVDFIIVKPEVYTSILNKRITKIRIYKVNDSTDSAKTIIRIGKVALSGAFDKSVQTVSALVTAYNNMSSDRTYDVASYNENAVIELDCDITLVNGEYLCFETVNGHCVGYCTDSVAEGQMMYVYQDKVTCDVSQHVPISVTVEE